MALGDCFFLLHKANEFIRATNVEKQVVKRKQQNVLFCLDGVNWSHIIAGNVTRLSSCQGACFPPISFPGGKKKKREKEVNMSTGSVFCSHRLGVVGAHDHLLVILYLIFPNSHTAFCEGPMRAIHISWERIQLCLSSLALFMNSECRTLHEGALMGKRAFGLVRAKLFHLCLTLCNPMDCSPPGSSVHGTLQARMLEWAAISYSRGSS